MSDIILGASIGGLAAVVISIPAIIMEIIRRGQVKNLPLVIDVKNVFETKLSQFASFALGVLLHIFMGMFFGAIYPAVENKGWLNYFGQPYGIISLLVYVLIIWLIFNFIFFPILGLGWLARREGNMVWCEVLVSLLLIAVLFYLAMPLFQPVFF